jgi:DNA-binding transcriptional LysR family regulator
MKVLIALDESGSMHRAADALSMTQPGITKALQEIEAALGAELFERSPRGIKATPTGRCVIRYAYILYTELDQMSAEINAINMGQGSVISVGAVAGAFPSLLVGAITHVRKAHPKLTVKIKEGTSANLLGELGEGLLDIAICRTAVAPNPDIFDRMDLSEEKISVVAGPRHALAGKNISQLSDLADCRWILFPNRMPVRRLLERELMEEGLDMPLYPLEASSTFVTVLMLNEDPELVALVSRETADFFAEKGILTILPIHIKARTEPYELVTRKGYVLAPAAMALIDEIKRRAARVG